MRVAAIDIGTNSVHMLVVRVRPDRSFEVIDREKAMVRLGAGGLDGRTLTPEAMTATLQTLSKFKRLADSRQVDEIVAVATSATREAANGGEFLRRIERDTGIRPRIISGIEEARLIHLAAVYGVDVGSGRAVVIDIGGGSVEITLGTGAGAQMARSFKLGAIRLTERFVKSDPLTHRDERRLARHVTTEAGRYLDQIAAIGYDRVIGTSGTILSLGAVASAGARGVAPGASQLRHRRVSAKALHRVRKRVTALALDERLAMPGLDPRRADLVVAGAVLLDTLLRHLGATELTLCDLALREGLILDYAQRNRKHIAHADRYPDVRRRSTIELAEKCSSQQEHARQVARLALALFDQTRGIHGLTDREREWLEFAALVHDIGMHISYRDHEKHSYYLVKHGDLRGFEPAEIEAIALLARYHRRGTPRKSQAAFAALPKAVRRAIAALAPLLRVAESLDRSHTQPLSGLELADRGDGYLLRLQASGDAELELWAAERHLRPFETLLGRPVRLEVTGNSHAEHTDDRTRLSRQADRGGRHRRLRQDDTARAAGEVARRLRPPRLRHGVELVGPRQGRDQGRQEEERPDAHDVQPAARDGFR